MEEPPKMILLDKSNYHKVSYLLDEVPFNILFAKAVVDNMVSGDIFVDQEAYPTIV